MIATETLSLDGGGAAPAARPAAYLVVAIECARPLGGASRYSLAAVDEVRIGRGARRAARRDGRVLTLEIPDSSLSSLHARLARADGGWRLEDAGSKNGTNLDGARVMSARLDDGGVIEAARTILVFADPGGDADAGDLDHVVDGDPLATLDPVLAERFATLERIARSTVSVVLLGETGTGKDHVARAIHARSGRAGPYVAVNCGALPATLVESELFGSRRGAFSGALEDRPGLVRAADGGTLFLDEIAELSAAAQASLLRVLQEREVLPIGAHVPVPVDLRVVAATCQPLPALVGLDRFRRDLHARIAGFTIELPPLRERRVDLGLMIARLLARHGGDHVPALERAAARLLFAHPWPDNVRELDQALAAALAISSGADLSVAHLTEALRPAPAARPTPVDRDGLEELLRAHRGNVSRVAHALATSRSQIRRLAARFGLALDAYRW